MRFGDDHDNPVADGAHEFAGQRRVRWDIYIAPIRAFERQDLAGEAGDRTDPVGSELGTGQNRENAGRFHCRASVEPGNVGMGDGRAQDIGVCLAGEIDVVGVAPAAEK